MIHSSYLQIRDQVRRGDIFAFGGRGWASDIIKFFTHYPVSHVGIVEQLEDTLFLLESTTLYKPPVEPAVKGVSINRLSDRIEGFNGEVWWLPLSDKVRAEIDWDKFHDLGLKEKGKSYNMAQAIISAVPVPQWAITDAVFCSQLDVYMLRECGVSSLKFVSPPSVNPKELVQMELFAEKYALLKGEERDLPGFNSRPPWQSNLAA